MVATLIRENRLFISPSRGLVDLLTNYPFNEERMQRMLELVAGKLDASGGYASLKSLREAICCTDLGGDWLTIDLLSDLLRRHGNYEFLPGGLVAIEGMQLTGWIQARARDALRAAEESLTSDELLAEVPDLAAFSCSLPELLEGDPMVHSPDGLHWQVR